MEAWGRPGRALRLGAASRHRSPWLHRGQLGAASTEAERTRSVCYSRPEAGALGQGDTGGPRGAECTGCEKGRQAQVWCDLRGLKAEIGQPPEVLSSAGPLKGRRPGYQPGLLDKMLHFEGRLQTLGAGSRQGGHMLPRLLVDSMSYPYPTNTLSLRNKVENDWGAV